MPYPSTEFHVFSAGPYRHQVWRDVWSIDRRGEKDCRSDLMGEYTTPARAEMKAKALSAEHIASQEAQKDRLAALRALEAQSNPHPRYRRERPSVEILNRKYAPQ